MEALVNFLVPEENAVEPVYMQHDRVTTGRDQRGELTINYRDRIYENHEDAYATQAVVDVFLNDDVNDHQSIEVDIELILNPPEGIDLDDYAFDVDLTYDQRQNTQFLRENGRYFTYYVSKANYSTSCPHNEKHDHRVWNNGVISCFFNDLVVYSKLIDWRNNNKDKLRFQKADLNVLNRHNEIVPVTIDKQKLVTAVLQPLIKDPVVNFQEYIVGVLKGWNRNTLTKNRLYYDSNKGEWNSGEDILTIYHDPQVRKMDYLYKYLSVYQDDTVSMYDKFQALLAILSNNDTQLEKYHNFMRPLVTYYGGLSAYPSHLFSLDGNDTWIKITNGIFFIPCLSGKLESPTTGEDLTMDFIDIITKINALNVIV
jgi:hypothetical protein